ncbi:hypothetical protein [Polymorphospora sp. A560]|uniref:Uncharacterized protein n=1 Tax=Polymorphospora lycopeni TaxID=3140240 RepID=A0ABV5CPF1_9ACTN
MKEEELREAMLRYEQDGQNIAAAEAERRERRDAALRRAKDEGWRPADLVEFTGWSKETIRKALNPEARETAAKAKAEHRAATRPPTPEEWWASLTPEDQAAYAEAARPPVKLPRELAEKMAAAGVRISYWGFEGNELEAQWPRRFLTFMARQRQK